MMLALVLCLIALPLAAAGAAGDADLTVVNRIKAEAFENSKVMDYVFQLTDVNGPRITNSPGYHRAVEWCLKELEEAGLENVAAEPFECGKGWSFSHFSIRMREPSYAPLTGFPLAWSRGTNGVVSAEPVLAVLKEDAHLEKFKGKLKGKIVLIDEPRKIELNTRALGSRYSERQLEERALAPDPEKPRDDRAERREKRRAFTKKLYQFLNDEGVVAVLRTSYKGEAGLVAGGSGGSREAEYAVPPPAVALMAEHYNRVARLLEKEIPVKIELEVEARFHEDNLNPSNVVAEIPGGAKSDEVVMMGGHLDSWHGGTGAVDNAAGVAIAMEAARILKALDLKMDRTVRVGLWGGEEQGFVGSRAYVKEHFGDYETMDLKPGHSKLSAYYNYDNGSGKIRGIYLQGNDMLRPVFEAWMKPFHDMGATTVTIRNTSGTDHVPFDAVGLPGFQFIQDPLEYGPRTHHSNADQFDHVIEADIMQSAVIMASFVYHTANRAEMLPRKPLPKPSGKKEDNKEPAKKESP